MSYHALGLVDSQDPNSPAYAGPLCGNYLFQELEAAAARKCSEMGAGLPVQADTAKPMKDPDPNALLPWWSYHGTCANGGKVYQRGFCNPGMNRALLDDASYSPPGFVPGKPPEPTVKCPTGPPQPKGKCCPEGLQGTAPNCYKVLAGGLRVKVTQKPGGSVDMSYLNTGSTGGGRPPPIPTQSGGGGGSGSSRSGLLNALKPSTIVFFDPALTATKPAPATIQPGLFSLTPSGGGTGPSVAQVLAPPPPMVDGGVTPGQTTATPSSTDWRFVIAMVAVAMVAVGGFGYAWYEYRKEHG